MPTSYSSTAAAWSRGSALCMYRIARELSLSSPVEFLSAVFTITRRTRAVLFYTRRALSTSISRAPAAPCHEGWCLGTRSTSSGSATATLTTTSETIFACVDQLLRWFKRWGLIPTVVSTGGRHPISPEKHSLLTL